MRIDDTVVQKYLEGFDTKTYSDFWVYKAVGRGDLFEEPDTENRDWVAKLLEKLKSQIMNYVPRNYSVVKELFSDFDNAASDFTVLLVVGFPDPYDAMFFTYEGREYVVFDLIQFGADSLDESYSCHRVLTHELIHLCIKNKYPLSEAISYTEYLDYTAFDEGFAHALTFPEDFAAFAFDDFLQDKYNVIRKKLEEAYFETDITKQKQFTITADSGDYWDKFASISGKLYLLKNKDKLKDIYQAGWHDFSMKIIND